jgi:hypothetical protein
MIDKDSFTSYQGEGEVPPAPISLPPLPDVSNYGMDGTVWPDIQTPIYGSEDIQAQPPFIDADIGALRNNPGEYFKVFYNPKGNGAWPQLRFTQGLIVEGTELSRVGSVTYSAVDGNPVIGHTAGQNPTNKTVWLNVTNDRSASSVSLNKDSSADFSFELARIDGNGNIQQLHSGALVIGGGGGSFPFRVTTRRQQNPVTQAWETFAVVDKGGFRDTKMTTVPLTQFGTTGKVEIPIVTTGTLPVQLEWNYTWPYAPITGATVVVDDSPWDGKTVVTPITSDTGTGKSKCVLALLEVTANPQGGFDATVKSQLVTTGLRAMWYSAYVDDISGRMGQYAEASITNPDA